MASDVSSEEGVQTFHGGRLVARRLKAHGVSKLFTLSGGHLFSIYDGCRSEGIDIVDVRHESTAAFAAEGWAKVTREAGVCALTAGPGVTNGMSAMASAQASHSPIVVLGGRAPAARWGSGSLQEIDHVPFVRPLSKLATTAESTQEIPALVDDAFAAALMPHGGPAFVDFPLDLVFMEAADAPAGEDGDGDVSAVALGRAGTADGAAIEAAGRLLTEAERPVVMAGSDLYWGRGEHALLELCEELRVPVFLNGLARGCVPADHELFFSRARGHGAEGRRRGDRDRRADGLPAGLRRSLRRGHRDRRRRRGGTRAQPPASGGGRVLRRHRLDAGWHPRGCLEDGLQRELGQRAASGRERAPRGRARGAGRTTARRFTRCASTASWPRCSTATRS